MEYTCDIGYKLDGNLRQTCLSNGKWSGSKPTCNSKKMCFAPGSLPLLCRLSLYYNFVWIVINCGDPGQPKNGNTVAADGYTYGNDVRFSCNDNYVLEGSVVATCEINEKWSRSLPVCLGTLINSSLKFVQLLHNVIFSCLTYRKMLRPIGENQCNSYR